MNVVLVFRRKRKTTRITSVTEIASVLSVSRTDADGGSLIHGHLQMDRLRDGGLELRDNGADTVHGADDVGARLAEDDYQNRRFAVRIARGTEVFHGVLCTAHIGDA